MKFAPKYCVSLGLLVGLVLQPTNANASWDPYENLRIALGNWTPTPIFKVESSSDADGSYQFIKGNATEIFIELGRKKAELLMLVTQIQQLEECKVQACLKIVEETSGMTTNTKISLDEINNSLEKLNLKYTVLDKFVLYVENKLVSELPNIKLALDVEIRGGKTELRDYRDNIKNMISSGKVTPIGKADEYIEIKTATPWSNHNFEFSGTVTEVANMLKEAKTEVSKNYENLTGIKAIFSEFGNKIVWDVSSAKNPIGFNFSTDSELAAYSALKELSVANYYAQKKIIESALFKPVDQRSELESSIIKTNIDEVKENLEIFIKQRERNIKFAELILAKETPKLLQEKNDLIGALDSNKLDLDLISKQKIETRIQYIDEYLSSLSESIQGRNFSDCSSGVCEARIDGDAREIARLSQQLRELAPENAEKIINTVSDQSIKQANYEAQSGFFENELAQAKLALNDRTKNANDWVQNQLDNTGKAVAELGSYFDQQIVNSRNQMAQIINEYISKGQTEEEAKSSVESKFAGIIERLEADKQTALDNATSSFSEKNLIDTAKDKFGIETLVEQIGILEQNLDSIVK